MREKVVYGKNYKRLREVGECRRERVQAPCRGLEVGK